VNASASGGSRWKHAQRYLFAFVAPVLVFLYVAGVLLGTIFVVQPSMGGIATLKAFVVVTLGGISSFAGGIAGGLVLGLAESFGAIIAPAYKDAVGFILVMLVLLYKPDGLFGKKLS
jgi:branched-chain amino acid transport system permease protein